MARRRAPGRGSTYQDERGRWIAQIYINGRKVRRSATSQSRAERLLDELRDRRDLGAAPTSQTVAEYMASWLEDTASQRVRPSTLQGYEEKTRNYIVPAIGRLKLDRLSPQHVHRMLSEMSRRGLSPLTVRHTRAVLRNALSQAERWGLVTRNAAALTEAPRVQQRERRTLSASELARLLDHVEDARLLAAYATAATTGVRQGELLGLLWDDVDLDRGMLHVRRSVTRVGGRYVEGEPKTARGRRTVPIPRMTAELLRNHRRQQRLERMRAEAWEDRGLVFPNRTGGQLYGPDLTRQLQNDLEAAGLPRITFHDLRHCASSLLEAGGASPRVTMELLGHSTIAMTMDVYTHVSEDAKRAAADSVGALLERAAGSS